MKKPVKILLIVLGAVTVHSLLVLLAVGLLITSYTNAKIEIYDDPALYTSCLAGSDRDGENKWSKWDMDESIWPREITSSMQVADFKMVYYDPWDKQYLGYLVVDYTPDDYKAEKERLAAYPSTEYTGYYGVTGSTTYPLLAVCADSYQGFVYALDGGNSRIIYAEEIFCNYFMDLDYKKYIPEEYLLDGFDATQNNPYEKMMRSKNR